MCENFTQTSMGNAMVSSTDVLSSAGGMNESLNALALHEDNRVQRPISDSDPRWWAIVILGMVSAAISLFGIFANIINIAIFLKQGLNETVNISLLGLAVSDFGLVLTQMWMCISMNPLFRYSDIPFESVQVQHITGGSPNDCFSRITCWITAYLSLERCICIASPLKVKNIITVKGTSLMILGIFVFNIIATTPFFSAMRIGSIFVAERNRTLLGLIYLDNGLLLVDIVLYISVFIKFSSIPIVISCTVVLIRNLLSKSQWRKTASGISASGVTETSATLRDKRVVKMVSLITCIFMICFLPSCINIVVIIILSPEYNIGGQFENAFAISWAIISCLEATNSSVNIVVYYNMSSKYRAVFNKYFGVDRQ